MRNPKWLAVPERKQAFVFIASAVSPDNAGAATDSDFCTKHIGGLPVACTEAGNINASPANRAAYS